MKIVAVICNIVLVAFTGFVLLTDGMATEAPYRILGLLLLLVPILSAVVLLRGGITLQAQKTGDGLYAFSVRWATVLSNLVLLGFSCWAIVDQYPHPEEVGVVPYEVLVVFTPILNLLTLLGGRKGLEQQRAVAERQ